MLVRGEGPYLYDQAGNRFFDGVASWWCCNLGHSHPGVVEAIQRQAAELQHSILGNLSHPRAVEIATLLAHSMPTPDRHVHFAADGASAVEAALKIAVQYAAQNGAPERTGFMSLREAYHGDTLATVALGYIESFHRPFEHVLNRAAQLPLPPYDGTPEECMAQADALFAAHGPTTAALIVEPLCQGAAGVRTYPAAYLTHLEQRCREYGILLIVDEIAMGFYRTGSHWAFEQARIDPDIVCTGKGVTNGTLPLSGAIVKDRLFEAFSDDGADHTFYHGHTFAGNPIAAAAGVAAMTAYREEGIKQQVLENAPVLHRQVESLSDCAAVSEIRTLGMIAVAELQADLPPVGRKTAGQAVQESLREQGILVRPLGSVLYLMPPLNTPADLLEQVAERFVSAVRSLAR